MKIKKTEQGFVLLSTMFIALFLTILIGAAFIKSDVELREVNIRRAVQEAFYTAESGIERAVSELRLNPNWQPGVSGAPPIIDERLNIEEDNDETTIGFLTLVVEPGGFVEGLGDTRWVRAIGRDAFNDLTRVIIARVLIDDPSRFLVSTPGTLKFKSGADITADVFGKDLFFDVNTSLPTPGERAIRIDGDVLYINDLNPTDPNSDPDITVTGAITQYPSVTFPGVDLERFRNIAENSDPLVGHVEPADVDIDLDDLSNLNSDPGFNPLIIFVDGNVNVLGEFSDSVLIVASENIFINGDVKPSTSATIGSQIGLFAKQDVIIPDGAISLGGDLDLEAFIIADGGGDANGEFRAESSVGLGTLNFTGAISVKGEGEDGETGVNLNAFNERVYAHTQATNVPFSPFIANIIQWAEALETDTFPPS